MSVKIKTTGLTGDVYLTAFKAYTALLSQAGTSNPTVIVLNSDDSNYLGNLVWTRSSAGVYNGTLAGAFVLNKTVVFPFGSGLANVYMGLGFNTPFDYCYGIYPSNVDIIQFAVYQTSDFSSVDLSAVTVDAQILIEIRVYPS